MKFQFTNHVFPRNLISKYAHDLLNVFLVLFLNFNNDTEFSKLTSFDLKMYVLSIKTTGVSCLKSILWSKSGMRNNSYQKI